MKVRIITFMVYDLKDMHGGEGVGEVAANIQ
jgi:hypothetical protein